MTLALASNEDAAFIGQLIGMLVMGIICGAVAKGRGRSPVGWFFIGFFFACLALIILLVLPDMKKVNEDKEALELANRQLREQLNKERAVADARHQLTERRLAAHDQVLQLDTSVSATSPMPALASPGLAQWYYVSGTSRLGPFAEEDVQYMIRSGKLTRATLVWREGMADWQLLGSVPELRDHLS